MAAAACTDRPPHCSHSNIIFVNVDISKVLATFFVVLEARWVDEPSLALNPPEPLQPQPVWGKSRKVSLKEPEKLKSWKGLVKNVHSVQKCGNPLGMASTRNGYPFVTTNHSKWLRNNPQGPHGPLGPEGAQGARRALTPGPEALRAGEPEKTRNDIMALRVRFVAT